MRTKKTRKSSAQQAKQLLNHVSQFDTDKFRVQSETDPPKSYIVTSTNRGLICECPDNQFSRSDCKHIHAVFENLKQNKCYKNNPFRIMERSELKLCKFCDSGNLKKDGFRKRKDGKIRIFKCLDCKRKFTANFGFEKKKFSSEIITQALQMYYSKMSVRRIADHFELMGIKVNHMTIYNWISEYSWKISDYLDGIVPRTANRFTVRADEIYIKVGGVQKYLFASMEDDSRYWLAYDMAHSKFLHDGQNLLKMTKKQLGGVNQTRFESDKSPVYPKASRRVFGRKTEHHGANHLRGERNNNMMERLNGEIRDREQNFRGLKKIDSLLIPGMRIYNFTKKHSGIGDKTPAEQALILVDGANKWNTLIQNAALYRISE